MEWIVLTIVLVALALFWIYQFAQLMTLSDDDFPGRYDKALWVVAFVAVSFLAALAFSVWKGIMPEVQASERETKRTQDEKPPT